MRAVLYFAICLLTGWLFSKAFVSLKRAHDKKAFAAKHWAIWFFSVAGLILFVRFVGRDVTELSETVGIAGCAVIVLVFIWELVVSNNESEQ